MFVWAMCTCDDFTHTMAKNLSKNTDPSSSKGCYYNPSTINRNPVYSSKGICILAGKYVHVVVPIYCLDIFN